jgi:hypothetical protein
VGREADGAGMRWECGQSVERLLDELGGFLAEPDSGQFEEGVDSEGC